MSGGHYWGSAVIYRSIPGRKEEKINRIWVRCQNTSKAKGWGYLGPGNVLEHPRGGRVRINRVTSQSRHDGITATTGPVDLSSSEQDTVSAVQCSAVQCSAVQCSAICFRSIAALHSFRPKLCSVKYIVKCSAVHCSAGYCSEAQCRAVQRSSVQCSVAV